MEREEAVTLLKCHCFSYDDLSHPKMDNGFIGSLRPYRGYLIEENFHELMEILRVLATELKQPTLDREVMACLWGISHMARAWAVEPEGMLRSNNLISDEQVELMEQWLNMFSYAVMVLIEGGGEEEAFWEYHQYVQEENGRAEKGEI
ncbi:hypothetical protein MHH93_00300 [Priestia sp. FSL H7-0729]